MGLLAILAGQALWGGWLSARGWFYQDDLSALDEASGRSLGWNFLRMPVNDHLVPGYRLVFWLQRHTDPLGWTQTVIARVLLQTLAIWLLARLFILLFGRRPSVLIFVGLYAINPLILGNLTWLTTAACLVPAEIAAILAVDAHVRYTVTGRLRWAAVTGLSLLAGMCFWEKTAIIGIMLPVLSLGFLSTGSIGDRLRELVKRWRGWLLAAIPPLVFVAYFIGHHYGGSAREVKLADMVSVVKTGWLRMATPALFGGPWHWFDAGTAYVSWSAPSRTMVVLSQLAFVALVFLGWRRTGPRSLLGWLLPIMSVTIGTIVVAVGRYFAFGDLIAITMRYSFDFAFALVLGAGLALLPSSPDGITARAAGTEPAPSLSGRPAPSPLLRPAVLAVCVLLVGSSVFSNVLFEQRWLKNPTKPYVDRLLTGVRQAGPGVNLYDTSVSNTVVPYFFGPTMHLSTLLSWTDAKVRFDQTDTAPLLVDQQGNLVAANLLPAASGVLPSGALCQALVQGVGTWRIPLDKQLPLGDGFMHLEYFQQHPSTLSVLIEDASGRLLAPTTGSRVSFPVTLGAQLLRLPQSEARAVVIKSDSAAANICVGGVVIGAPFAPAK